SKIEAAKRFAPILTKETENTTEELKKKLSGETYKQLNCNSVCQLKAMEVKTDEWLMTTSDVIRVFFGMR
ncbi:hypothetical protein HID58_028439, partial [Brassica napus]